jgi:small subunit ribosomal protein S4
MHKKYESPKHPWDKLRIDREAALRKKYGLKSKKEIWRSETILRGFRREARRLQAMRGEASDREEKELMQRLVSLNLIEEGATLDDVLRLQLDDVLRRRLQTVVLEKGLATTPKQSRQFIKHGHIVVKGRSVTVPSYLVRSEEEGLIGHHKNSNVSQIVAARPVETTGQKEA